MWTPILAFGLGPMEMIIFGIIAVLLFGKRLPEVARSMGKGLTEFKRGVSGIEDEVSQAEDEVAKAADYDEADDKDESTAPKFEPPPGEPKEEEETVLQKRYDRFNAD